jgi:hypothetical protein
VKPVPLETTRTSRKIVPKCDPRFARFKLQVEVYKSIVKFIPKLSRLTSNCDAFVSIIDKIKCADEDSCFRKLASEYATPQITSDILSGLLDEIPFFFYPKVHNKCLKEKFPDLLSNSVDCCEYLNIYLNTMNQSANPRKYSCDLQDFDILLEIEKFHSQSQGGLSKEAKKERTRHLLTVLNYKVPSMPCFTSTEWKQTDEFKLLDKYLCWFLEQSQLPSVIDPTFQYDLLTFDISYDSYAAWGIMERGESNARTAVVLEAEVQIFCNSKQKDSESEVFCSNYKKETKEETYQEINNFLVSRGIKAEDLKNGSFIDKLMVSKPLLRANTEKFPCSSCHREEDMVHVCENGDCKYVSCATCIYPRIARVGDTETCKQCKRQIPHPSDKDIIKKNTRAYKKQHNIPYKIPSISSDWSDSSGFPLIIDRESEESPTPRDQGSPYSDEELEEMIEDMKIAGMEEATRQNLSPPRITLHD